MDMLSYDEIKEIYGVKLSDMPNDTFAAIITIKSFPVEVWAAIYDHIRVNFPGCILCELYCTNTFGAFLAVLRKSDKI